MTTAEKHKKLTPRQSEVLRHLRKGERPSEIAKKLHVTDSNIHGHIKRIRDAGVEVPASSNGGSAKASPNGGGNTGSSFAISAVSTPEERAREALAEAQAALTARMETIDERARQFNEEMAQLGTERSELEQRSTRYVEALDALG